MFCSTFSGSALPFIHSYELGWVKQCPTLRYCQVSFKIDHYQDSLFEQLGIAFSGQLTGAVTKRRAEYLAARFAAQQLLQAAGCQQLPTTAADRAPLWPAGWCGSLSHSHEYALAVVAPLGCGVRPGCDIELLAAETMCNTADMFTSAAEQALLAATSLDFASALLITFSAKESLYKALYPEVGRFFGFEAARVCQLEPQAQRITLELTQTLTANLPQGSQFQGSYQLFDNRVITLFT